MVPLLAEIPLPVPAWRRAGKKSASANKATADVYEGLFFIMGETVKKWNACPGVPCEKLRGFCWRLVSGGGLCVVVVVLIWMGFMVIGVLGWVGIME